MINILDLLKILKESTDKRISTALKLKGVEIQAKINLNNTHLAYLLDNFTSMFHGVAELEKINTMDKSLKLERKLYGSYPMLSLVIFCDNLKVKKLIEKIYKENDELIKESNILNKHGDS